MSLPGTVTRSVDQPPPRSAPTDTGVAFVPGITERGPSIPVLVRSLSEYVATFGQRITYGLAYDWLDTFFREGGNKAYVSRVLGPAPVIAQATLNDGAVSPVASLIVRAKSAGVWANQLAIQAVAGVGAGTVQLSVQSPAGTEIERSPDLTTQQDAVNWAQFSTNVNVTLGASALLPAAGTAAAPVAAVALTGGTGDHANAVDAQWRTALGAFTKDLGPGQVSMPGRTTAAAHTDLLAHAQANNRVAVLDAPDTPTATTLRATAAAQRTGVNARYGALFAPWITVPGVAPNTTRTVPPSALVCGAIARSDLVNSPNVPAAGENGQARYALGVSQTYSDADRALLNDAGMNVILTKYGGVRVYGWRTLVDPVLAPTWLAFSNSRLYMAIAAQANAIAESEVLKQLDGRRIEIAKFGGKLTGMLLDFYGAGSLFGATPDDAFRVDVGPQVNTLQSMSAGELHAVLALKFSPFAETVYIDIAKTPITEVLG